MAEPFPGAVPHLLAELGYLDLLLRRATVVARARRPTAGGEAFRGLIVSDAEIDHLMRTVTVGNATRDTETLIAELDEQIEQRRIEIRARIAESRRQGRHLPLARVAEFCTLSEAETDLLLVAIAPELDVRYETLYAYLQDDVTRKRPGVAMALDLICRSIDERVAARRFLGEDAPLRRFHLLTLGEEHYDHDPTLLRRFLKLDEAVLRFLLDQSPVASGAVQRVVMPGETVPELSVSDASAERLDALAQALTRTGTERSLVQLSGGLDAPLEEAATALGHALGRPLLFVDSARLAEPDAAAVVARDAALLDAVPVLPGGSAERQFWERATAAQLGVIVLARPDDRPLLPPEARPWRLVIEGPEFAARAALWQDATRGAVADADPERLADLFPFGAARIRQTVALAYTQAALREPSGPAPNMTDLLQAGRTLAMPNLQRFAITVRPRFDWDDLVLPPERTRQLQSIVARVTHRSLVQRDWGFGDKHWRGRGVAALLSGPPGTGKTMAAEVIARSLSLDLFQIDLSTVVSKYVGEAEKQLAMIFAEAEQGQCILFFDECDSVFGRRTEVKDAHDRYANTEVNYLLQRLEQYEGIVLLATNFQKNIDEAFLRRLNDSIEFPFPDESARAEIWRRQFSPAAPLDPAVDFAALGAQFRLAGGNIRSAAVYAAYRAAEMDGRDARIGMAHLMEGVRREFQKQGKLVVAGEPAGPAR